MIREGFPRGSWSFLFLQSLTPRFGPNRRGGMPPVGAEGVSMGSLSIWHWIVVIAVVLLLFGRGKISELMGDVAQGIKAFKKGMSDDEVAKTEPGKPDMKVIDNDNAAIVLKARSATEKRVEGSTA